MSKNRRFLIGITEVAYSGYPNQQTFGTFVVSDEGAAEILRTIARDIRIYSRNPETGDLEKADA